MPSDVISQYLKMFPGDLPSDVRLVHGGSPTEGVVEICFGGKWGSVCNNDWDESDAAVVCGQLGFSRQGEEGSIPPRYFWYYFFLFLLLFVLALLLGHCTCANACGF